MTSSTAEGGSLTLLRVFLMASAPSCVADISISEPEDRQLDEGGGGGGGEERQVNNCIGWLSNLGGQITLKELPWGYKTVAWLWLKEVIFHKILWCLFHLQTSKFGFFEEATEIW